MAGRQILEQTFGLAGVHEHGHRLQRPLFRIADVTGFLCETPELPDTDFRAPHPETIFYVHQSRRFTFVRFACACGSPLNEFSDSVN